MPVLITDKHLFVGIDRIRHSWFLDDTSSSLSHFKSHLVKQLLDNLMVDRQN